MFIKPSATHKHSLAKPQNLYMLNKPGGNQLPPTSTSTEGRRDLATVEEAVAAVVKPSLNRVSLDSDPKRYHNNQSSRSINNTGDINYGFPNNQKQLMPPIKVIPATATPLQSEDQSQGFVVVYNTSH